MAYRKFSQDDFKDALSKSDIKHGSFFNPKTGKNVELVGHSSAEKKANKPGKPSKSWKTISRNMLKKDLLSEVKEIDEALKKLSAMPYKELSKMRKDNGVKIRAPRKKKNKIPKEMEGQDKPEPPKEEPKDPVPANLPKEEKENPKAKEQDKEQPSLDANAGNIRLNITLPKEEKAEQVKEEKINKVVEPEPEPPAVQLEDTHVAPDTASLPVAEQRGDPVIGEGPLLGQTGAKGIRGRRIEDVVEEEPSVSQVDIPRDTEVVEIEREPEPIISGAFKQEQEISMEARSRIKKTERDLKIEINCFRALYKDLIKDPLFLSLNSQSLDGKSISQLRGMHEQYSELIRGYYEKGRGLKIGVIVDPQVLNLNLMGLQQMFSNQMDSSNRIVRSSANMPVAQREAQQQGGRVVKSSEVHEPTKATMVGDIHYVRGGLAVAQQKPPEREMRGLSKGLDLNRRQNIEVSIGKRAVPKSFVNYKNYMVPARREMMNTNIKIGK